MKDASNSHLVEKVFTQYVHHRNLSAIYLVQNMFFQVKLAEQSVWIRIILFCLRTLETTIK